MLLQRGEDSTVEVAFLSAPHIGDGRICRRWELTGAAVMCSISPHTPAEARAASAAVHQNRRKLNIC